MAKWVDAGVLSELPLGTVKKYEVADIDMAIAHTSEGVFAVEDVCSHAEVALSEGELSGCFLECWLHGSAFDLKTGMPSGPPATKPVQVFPVQIQGEGDTAIITVQVSE
ncbi:MAG: hypothetical protein RIS75_1301 [Actinomycetota bacterium]|jgi:3-phenylpropionate/trans-cinnamate dioxygenase ferredoxin subunit